MRANSLGYVLSAAVIVGLLSIGQAAAMEAEGAAPAQASPAATRGKDGKVCQYEDVTGSRMKKRVCYTPEQWDARERAAKNAVREIDARNVAGEHKGT